MNSTGQNNTKTPQNESVDVDSVGVPWWIIGASLLVLIFVVSVSIRVGGVLTGLLFPPLPPIPVGVEQVKHINRGHGTDEWEYYMRPAPCSVAGFYEDEGGTCEYQPGYCQDDGTRKQDVLVATCDGIKLFSNFFMVWEVEILDFPEHTEINLSRDITWFAPSPIHSDQ